LIDVIIIEQRNCIVIDIDIQIRCE